ncbi:MAG: SDR family NAD(P)-dependent oxidoreductase [Puia sp.]|nr:SDR family NAD(P)-dependent oxidoreductase [Puia sp.]
MKKIVLTGSATGFGLLAVKSLAAKGHTVFATMRNINAANAQAAADIRNWAKKQSADVRVVELDVTSDASVKTAIGEIASAAGGQIDVLINNAGLGFTGVSESLTTAQTEQLFQVNVIGADRLIKAVLPYMHKQKEGLIVNVTSVQARNHIPLLTTYNATKAALDALSVGYHYELRSLGIDVAIIQPGGLSDHGYRLERPESRQPLGGITIRPRYDRGETRFGTGVYPHRNKPRPTGSG